MRLDGEWNVASNAATHVELLATTTVGAFPL